MEWSYPKEQLIFGSGMGFAFLTAVEVLDGFSSEWGASSGDIIANASALLYLSPRNYCGRSNGSHQNFLSYHAIRPYRPNVLGSSLAEQI
jgi:hypothetical protein